MQGGLCARGGGGIITGFYGLYNIIYVYYTCTCATLGRRDPGTPSSYRPTTPTEPLHLTYYGHYIARQHCKVVAIQSVKWHQSDPSLPVHVHYYENGRITEYTRYHSVYLYIHNNIMICICMKALVHAHVHVCE